MNKNPYQIIKSKYVTEKSTVFENLKANVSNRSVAAFKDEKWTFLVDPSSNKHEITKAIEEIYAKDNVKVLKVNTINVKPKIKNRRGKYRTGRTNMKKKAIVTLQK